MLIKNRWLPENISNNICYFIHLFLVWEVLLVIILCIYKVDFHSMFSEGFMAKDDDPLVAVSGVNMFGRMADLPLCPHHLLFGERPGGLLEFESRVA